MQLFPDTESSSERRPAAGARLPLLAEETSGRRSAGGTASHRPRRSADAVRHRRLQFPRGKFLLVSFYFFLSLATTIKTTRAACPLLWGASSLIRSKALPPRLLQRRTRRVSKGIRKRLIELHPPVKVDPPTCLRVRRKVIDVGVSILSMTLSFLCIYCISKWDDDWCRMFWNSFYALSVMLLTDLLIFNNTFPISFFLFNLFIRHSSLSLSLSLRNRFDCGPIRSNKKKKKNKTEQNKRTRCGGRSGCVTFHPLLLAKIGDRSSYTSIFDLSCRRTAKDPIQTRRSRNSMSCCLANSNVAFALQR